MFWVLRRTPKTTNTALPPTTNIAVLLCVQYVEVSHLEVPSPCAAVDCGRLGVEVLAIDGGGVPPTQHVACVPSLRGVRPIVLVDLGFGAA